MQIKNKAFQDEKCTCDCGNTHEFYGGKGYTTLQCNAICSNVCGGNGYYIHTVKCNVCGQEHTLKY